MKEKKEYLSEENYQRTKNKITKLSKIILVVGLMIGVGLIIVGIVLQVNAKRCNEDGYNRAYKEMQDERKINDARLKEIETEKSELNSQIEKKEYECDSLDKMDSNWFANVSKCQRDVSSLKLKLNELGVEEFKLKNADYTVYYNEISSFKYIIFYVLGIMVIFASLSMAGIIYIIAKRREITAFTVQQTMPLAQEGIEKMAPTVVNAVGTIGKSLAKGIKEGINEADNK